MARRALKQQSDSRQPARKAQRVPLNEQEEVMLVDLMARKWRPRGDTQNWRWYEFDADMAERILVSVRTGLPLDQACYFHAFPFEVVQGWLAHAEEAEKRVEKLYLQAEAEQRTLTEAEYKEAAYTLTEEQYVIFKRQYERARAVLEQNAIAAINAAMSRDWRAAQWLLMQARPEYYARQTIYGQPTGASKNANEEVLPRAGFRCIIIEPVAQNELPANQQPTAMLADGYTNGHADADAELLSNDDEAKAIN